MKKFILVGLIVLGLAGAGVLWLLPEQSPVFYPTGERFTYQLNLTLASEVKRKPNSNAQSLSLEALTGQQDLDWKGSLELENLSQDSNQVWFRFLRETPLTIDDSLNQIQGQISISPQGKITEVAFSDERWVEQAPFVRDFFATLDHPDSSLGQDRETHVDYILLYTTDIPALSLSRPNFVKTYTSLEVEQGGQVEGQAELSFERNGVIHEARLVRQLNYAVGSQLDKKESLQYQLTRIESRQERVAAQTRTRARESFRGEATRAYFEQMVHQKVLGNLSTQEVLTLVLNQSGRYDGSFAENEAKVRALLALHPETATEVVRALDGLEADDSRFSSLAAALRDVGNPASERALREAVEQHAAHPQKQKYLIAYLSDVATPEVETEEFLQSLADSPTLDETLAKTAELGLGRMSAELLKSDRKRADGIVSKLVDKLSASEDKVFQRHLWSALGNTENPKVWAQIEPQYAREEDPDMKIAMLEAARFLPQDQAHELLLKESGHPNPTVSLVALQSLQYNQPRGNDAEVYEKILKTSTDLEILQATLKNLGSMVKSDPKSRQVLAWFIQNCAQSDLCALAESFQTQK